VRFTVQQVLALRVLESDEAPIIEDEDIDARETCRYDGVRAVAVRERELRKQAWQAAIDDAMPLTAGLLPEGTDQKRLADASWPGDQDVLMLDDPPTGRELTDQRPICR